MRHRRASAWVAALLVAALAGCGPKPNVAPWVARQTGVIVELAAPESVAVDPETGVAYVSSVVAPRTGEGNTRYWAEDGTGFITSLSPRGSLHQLQWARSTPAVPLNSLKGLCILRGVLYGADIDRIVRYSVATAQPLGPIPIPGSRRLNDLATDGTAVYASDTALGKIFRLQDSAITELKAPEGINGITFWKGRMFGVSWPLHEVYELDPAGKAEPVPFGLADRFKSLDGIEVLPDGSLLVSDLQGNGVFWIGRYDRRVLPFLQVESPADIGLDSRRMRLFVPSFTGDRLIVYQLDRR